MGEQYTATESLQAARAQLQAADSAEEDAINEMQYGAEQKAKVEADLENIKAEVDVAQAGLIQETERLNARMGELHHEEAAHQQRYAELRRAEDVEQTLLFRAHGRKLVAKESAGIAATELELFRLYDEDLDTLREELADLAVVYDAAAEQHRAEAAVYAAMEVQLKSLQMKLSGYASVLKDARQRVWAAKEEAKKSLLGSIFGFAVDWVSDNAYARLNEPTPVSCNT